MIAIDRELAARLVERARLAPSAHNIQPTRVALRDGRLVLHADPERRLPVSDPQGHDMRLSHGAFIEGLSIALSEQGLRIGEMETLPDHDGVLHPLARITAEAGGQPDPAAAAVAARATWRGAFRPLDEAACATLLVPLAAQPDLTLVTDRAVVARIAGLADEAGLHFMRDPAHRRELLDWMRLSQRHSDYERDGLNAEAMGLGRLEAVAAGWILGPLFPPLDRLGLAGRLTSEMATTAGVVAMAFFHRPQGEDLLVRGRALYRAWLAMEQAGLAARPVSVLTDWDRTNADMRRVAAIPADRHLVKVFRIGVPAGERRIAHARLPVAELLRQS